MLTRMVREVEVGTLQLLRRVDPTVLALLARRPVNDAAAVAVAAVLPLRFQAAKASGIDASVEIRLPHASDGHAAVTVHIEDGRCAVRPWGTDAPDLTLTIRIDHLLQMITGRTSARALLSDRRLQVSGDVLLFMRFPGLFGGVE